MNAVTTLVQELLKRPVGYKSTTAVWAAESRINARSVVAGLSLYMSLYDWKGFVQAMEADIDQAGVQTSHQLLSTYTPA